VGGSNHHGERGDVVDVERPVSTRTAQTRGSVRRIAAWVTRVPAAQAKAKRFVLATRGLSDETVVHTWDGKRRDEATQLAEEVVDAAQGDCDGRASDQHYELRLVDDERTHACTALRCKAEEPESVEPADIGGLVKQMMRHNEVMVRVLVASQEGVQKQLTEVNNLLAGRLAKLEKTRGDAMEMEQEALRIAATSSESEEERTDRRRREEKLLGIGEMVLRKLMAEKPS
jgi:hypothetical protein